MLELRGFDYQQKPNGSMQLAVVRKRMPIIYTAEKTILMRLDGTMKTAEKTN